MAKLSAINNNKKRAALAKQYAAKWAKLLAIAEDRSQPMDVQFEARMKMQDLPRNSNQTRVRNRCLVSGRPRAFYRRFKMSRIALRDLASNGMVPGVTKSSW